MATFKGKIGSRHMKLLKCIKKVYVLTYETVCMYDFFTTIRLKRKFCPVFQHCTLFIAFKKIKLILKTHGLFNVTLV